MLAPSALRCTFLVPPKNYFNSNYQFFPHCVPSLNWPVLPCSAKHSGVYEKQKHNFQYIVIKTHEKVKKKKGLQIPPHGPEPS